MKKIVFTLIILGIGISLSAQLRPNKKKQNKKTDLDQPYLHDLALTPCERDLRYFKIFLLHAIKKEENESLDMATIMPRARIVFQPNVVGKLVFVKTAGSVPFPVVGPHVVLPPSIYPVETEGISILDTDQNGQTQYLSLTYEAGDYSDVISVIDVYRVGNDRFADLKNQNGTIQTIMIFLGFAFDNDCVIPLR